MKKDKGLYVVFYCSFLLVLIIALFFEKEFLVYVKPFSLISLTGIYFRYVSKVNILYPISMFIVMINDTLVYFNFIAFFDIIAMLISLYYLMCILLLRKFVLINNFDIRKFLSFPILISVFFVGYLIYSITILILPALIGLLFFFILIVVSSLLFIGVCFYIYIEDTYESNFRLFVAASCCLFVSALLPINELYYTIKAFTVVINLAEMAGFYFFLKFLIDAKPVEKLYGEENFF